MKKISLLILLFLNYAIASDIKVKSGMENNSNKVITYKYICADKIKSKIEDQNVADTNGYDIVTLYTEKMNFKDLIMFRHSSEIPPENDCKESEFPLFLKDSIKIINK